MKWKNNSRKLEVIEMYLNRESLKDIMIKTRVSSKYVKLYIDEYKETKCAIVESERFFYT